MSAPQAVSKVQQLLQLARTAFQRINNPSDPVFAADIEKLKQLVNTITAEDFNVTPSLASKPWDYYPYVTNSPAACIEVFEGSDFSIGIFLLKPYKSMPLHDHPGMYGIMKLLFGSMTVTSYSNTDVSPAEPGTDSTAPTATPTSEFLARCISQVRLTNSSECCCLYPTKGNIHEIKAESEPVAFLDILAPPYSPNQGRDCNYYFRQPTPAPSPEMVYLKCGSNPSWFSCVPLKHEGLKVD